MPAEKSQGERPSDLHDEIPPLMRNLQCDLKRPVCTRCTRYPRGCVYDLRVVSQEPSVGQNQTAVNNNKDGSTGLNRQSLVKHTYQPSDNLSPWLSSTDSRFYMHIFSTETANRFFPAAPEIFIRKMISAALDTPHLLYALLAAACSHHSRLVRDTGPRSSIACLKFTNLAISNLNSALSNVKEVLRVETITTAMVLCTNDVCNGNMHTWRTHLCGVLQLLNTFLGTCSAYTGDAYVQCLVKWFTTMDIMAGLSAHRSSCIYDHTSGSLYQFPRTNAEDVDDICGYSLELVPILSRLSRLSSQVGSKAATGTEMLQSITWEAATLETEIDLLIEKAVTDTTSKDTGGLISELRHTHVAFVYAALLHLRRRVQMLPKNHIDVRRAVRRALEAVLRIPPSSPMNIMILWPIFSIGCESEIPGEREIIQGRMANMERIGMGNFTRTRKLLETYWKSDSCLPWSVYFSQLGLDLVLF